MHTLIDEANLSEYIQISCSIYDSIKIHAVCDPEIIKWINNTIIPLITTDLFTDTIVHNEAEGEIGFNWYDTVAISNGASIEEIEKAINEAKTLLEEAA